MYCLCWSPDRRHINMWTWRTNTWNYYNYYYCCCYLPGSVVTIILKFRFVNHMLNLAIAHFSWNFKSILCLFVPSYFWNPTAEFMSLTKPKRLAKPSCLFSVSLQSLLISVHRIPAVGGSGSSVPKEGRNLGDPAHSLGLRFRSTWRDCGHA